MCNKIPLYHDSLENRMRKISKLKRNGMLTISIEPHHSTFHCLSHRFKDRDTYNSTGTDYHWFKCDVIKSEQRSGRRRGSHEGLDEANS